MDYCLTLQINTFGPKNFDFDAWVKKCHFDNFQKGSDSTIQPMQKRVHAISKILFTLRF